MENAFLMPLHALIFLASAFVAEIIDTVIGFGSMLLLVPLVSLFLPVHQAIVLSGFFHLFGSFSRTVFLSRSIDKSVFFRFGLPAALAAPLGAMLLPAVDARILRTLLGGVLVFYALFSLFHHRLRLHKNPVVLTLTGAFSGFIAGLFGTTGAVQGGVLTSLSLRNRTYLGTAAAIALATDISRVFIYHRHGILEITPAYASLLFLVAILGATIGTRAVRRVEKRTESRIIFGALLVAGIYFISCGL